MGDDGGGHSGFGQGRGGNDGMSGAPMWQIKKKMAITDEQKEQIIEQLLREKEIKSKPAEPPWVLVDAVSSGESIKGKPLVRHVLVKDLNKVAALKNAELPSTGIFQMKDSARKAPMGLFAVFDGQSCAGEQGPIAAEFCARNFHVKLLANLTMLRPEAATDTYVKAAIIKSFHDLDAEYLVQHSDVHQGCGAAVALLIADYVIVAVLGKCSAVLVESVGGKLKPVPYGLSQAKPSDPSERIRLQKSGAVVVTSGNSATIRHPSGALSPVSRSIGDPLWKGQAAGGLGPEFLIPTPEVASIELKGHDSHPSLFLVASPVAECLSPQWKGKFEGMDFDTGIVDEKVISSASKYYQLILCLDPVLYAKSLRRLSVPVMMCATAREITQHPEILEVCDYLLPSPSSRHDAALRQLIASEHLSGGKGDAPAYEE